MSYNPAKIGTPASYVSSPAWSLNSLTSTTSSVSSTCPAPYMGSVGLPGTPRSSLSGSNYPVSNNSVPMTPGAPYMNTVPLPNPQAPSTYPGGPTSSFQLNPLLIAADTPAMRFDITQHPSRVQLKAGISNDALYASATHPAVTRMVLGIPGKYSFEVVNPAGLRVSDVLEAIFRNLQYTVDDTEYRTHNNSGQQHAVRSYARQSDQAGGNVRRCDYLQNKAFAGLSPSRASDGSTIWMIHLRPLF